MGRPRFRSLAAAGAALALAPALAAGHTGTMTATCDAVTFTYNDVAAGEQRSTESLRLDGAALYGPTLRRWTTVAGQAPQSFVVPIDVPAGVHVIAGRVEFVGSDGYRFTDTYTATVRCDGPTPAPEPPGGEQRPTPPPTPPPPPSPAPAPAPRTAPTCADLLERYPKAGPKRRAEWGCPAPTIRLPRKPDRPPTSRKQTKRVVTCSFVRAHYSPAIARRVLVRLGISTGCLPGSPPPKVTG